MTDHAHGRGVLLRALCSHSFHLIFARIDGFARVRQLDVNCLASTSSVYSITCARFCGVSLNTSKPVIDKYVELTNPNRITCLFINGERINGKTGH